MALEDLSDTSQHETLPTSAPTPQVERTPEEAPEVAPSTPAPEQVAPPPGIAPPQHQAKPRDPNWQPPQMRTAPNEVRRPTGPELYNAAPAPKRRGKPGRRPSPTGPRAQRTYQDMLAKAQASGDAERIAEAKRFGREVERARAERAAAIDAEFEESATPAGAAEPRIAHELDVTPEALNEGAGDAPPAEPPPPPRPLYMGQDAERVAMFASAVLQPLELLGELMQSMGVDVRTPRKRVLFNGIPQLQREVASDPLARIAELIGVEAAANFKPKEGAASESVSDRRVELAVLAGATFGPALLRFVPALATLPGKVFGGVKSVAALLRGRR